MIKLDKSNIRLDAEAADKSEAIRQVGGLLVDSGYIEPGYIDSMLAREKAANTYLGNGIAIPHGMPKDRELIRKTGISVAQVPNGVEWNPGETVHLVVGIAARSDEHIEMLANLTDVLDDKALVARLAKTDDPEVIVEQLSRDRSGENERPVEPATEAADFEKSVEVAVQGEHGLHARPATAFVDLAKAFQSDIRVRYKDKTANGKSLASLLKLGAEGGASIRIMAQGPDEDEALRQLRDAVESGLEEAEEAEAEAPRPAHGWVPASVGDTVPGIAASPGLAIGPIRLFIRRKIVVEATAKDPAAEEKRLRQSIAEAQAALEDLYQEVKERSGKGKASIFRAHAEFLNDPELVEETAAYIKKGRSAGWGWQKVIQDRVKEMEKLDDPVLAGRAVDLSDVGNRVLKRIAGVLDDNPDIPDEPVILIAEDLTPSDTANLDPEYILGFCTAGGGPTSHSAIIARSLDIPAIVGAGPALLHQPEGTLGILDGDSGNLYVDPSEADAASAEKARKNLQEARDIEKAKRFEPAITTDGHRIEVVANISRASEAEQAVNAGGEGVGLLRTEFLFLERSEPPSEEEQFEAYAQMVKALNGLPIIMRTLDIGGDKNAPYLNLPAEDNSFLGVRGIRLCLARPELFKPQLRAIFRASKLGPVRIMFPMIATLEDLAEAKAITEEVRREVGADPVEIGIMIEVPSAVAMAEKLAGEVDFFSIGTNDLTQYVLAMDRLHPMLAKKADGLHPAVLKMIDQTVKAAEKAGKWVGVCGGVAGDPKGAVLLAGLGVTELSVSIPSIAAVKARMRGFSLEKARKLAQKALDCRNAAEVRSLSFDR